MLLLDTCALLWLVDRPDALSDSAREAIRLHAASLHVSAITAFELAIKHRKKQLILPREPADWYGRALFYCGIREVPVTGQIAAASALLPPIHSDPCDRMIIATAVSHGLTIITGDGIIRRYPEANVLW